MKADLQIVMTAPDEIGFGQTLAESLDLASSLTEKVAKEILLTIKRKFDKQRYLTFTLSVRKFNLNLVRRFW